MTDRENIVTAIVAVAPGGALIGRVRLQKAVYLLERLGLGVELSFEYHHFGPYSRDLDNATEDAKALGLLEEVRRPRTTDGAFYSTFMLKGDVDLDTSVYRHLGQENVAALIAEFARTNVTVLELAATVDWLVQIEHIQDWRSEIVKRKGQKVLGGRLERAVDLLGTLGLEPAAVQA